MVDFLKTNGWALLVFAVVVAGGAGYSIRHRRRVDGHIDAFLQQHPDAAWLYLTSGMGRICIYEVNGGQPVRFAKGGKKGILVAPGVAELNLRYERTWPGFFSRSITRYTDPVLMQVTTRPGVHYRLSFDRKSSNFLLAEFIPQ